MANGRAHFLANVAAGATMTALAAYYAPDAVAPVAIGSTVATFVTPDADLEGRTHPETLLRRIWGVGLVFQWVWYPYSTLTRHRGLSHHVLLGTAGRVAYSAAIAAALLWLMQHVGWHSAALSDALARVTWPHVALFVGAWWAQDVVHYALDAM